MPHSALSQEGSLPTADPAILCRGFVSLDASREGLNGHMPDTWLQTGSWGKVAHA